MQGIDARSSIVRQALGVVAMVLFLLPSVANAAAPTTQPAEGQVRKWLSDLADTDAELREQARIELMGIHREQLPLLKRLVEESLPLQPSQAAVLREIVIHVYLAGERYEGDPEAGFIGLRWPPLDLPSMQETGLIVMERMPGFVGYRMLQEGDLILSIREHPQVQLDDPSDLSRVVMAERGGSTLHLDVLRQGKVVSVASTLDQRPRIADREMVEQFLRAREEKSEAYWKRDFESLLQRQVSASSDGDDPTGCSI